MARPESRRAVTAAASIVDLSKPIVVEMQKAARRPWQDVGWSYYRSMPEVRYPANWKGNALSRFVLRVGVRDPEDRTAPATIPEIGDARRTDLVRAAEEIVASLEGPQGGGPEILKRYSINMDVAADGWLIGTDQTAEIIDWEFVSIRELVFDRHDGKMQAYRDPVGDGEVDTSNPAMRVAPQYSRRFWVSHPERSQQADGALEALRDDCERLKALNESITARIVSRLATAGLLFIPNSVTLPIKPENASEQAELAEDPFIRQLIAYFEATLTNRGTAAGSLPILLRGPDDMGEKIKHITLDRTIDKTEMALRSELRETIVRGQDLPDEVQTGLGDASHWCVDDQTEVLTADGWKGHADVSVGDEVLTLNHDTGMSEWQPVLDLYRADVTDERMVLMDGNAHSSLTTGAHRWAVHQTRYFNGERRAVPEFATTDELNGHSFIPTAAPAASLPTAPKYDDDFVELVAWFGTDGHYRNTGDGVGSAYIVQSHTRNPERVERIRGALTRLIGPASSTLTGSTTPAWRETVRHSAEAFGGPITVFSLNRFVTPTLTAVAPNRVVSRDFIFDLTLSQLHLFTHVAELADGQHYRQGMSDIWQSTDTVLDAYELALILQGRMVCRTFSDGGERVVAWKQTSVRPVKAALQRTYTAKGAVREEMHYTGIIWCPTTPNGTWFARRKGKTYYTGNSAWSVMDSAVQNHLQPAANRFADGLTRVYLQPAIDAMFPDVPLAIRRSVVVVADGSGAVSKPNAAEDGRQLHDRIVISDAALRERGGAIEAETPSEEEALRILGRQMKDPYLATFEQDVAKRIDWDKVGKGNAEGAPGVGGTPPSRRPADSSDPVGNPGDRAKRDAKK